MAECLPLQPYTFSARVLYETLAKPHIFAVVNCADVALSVFYSPVLTTAGYFCSYELFCLSVESWFLLWSSYLER